MSERLILPVVEWDGAGARVVDPVSGRVSEGANVEEALGRAGNPRQVVLALGRRTSYIKQVRLPDVAKTEATKILRLRARDLFPVDPARLAMDLRLTSDRNPEGRLAIVVAADAEKVRGAREMLAQAGAKVVRVVPAALASEAVGNGHARKLLVQAVPHGVAYDYVQDGAVAYTRVADQESPVGAEITRTLAAAKAQDAVILAAGIDPGVPHEAVTRPPLASLHEAIGDLNLQLPEDAEKQSRLGVERRRTWFFISLMVAVVLMWLVGDERGQAQARIDRLNRDSQNELRRINDRKTAAESRLAEVKRTSTWITDALQPKQYATDVLSAVSNRVNADLWLTGLTFERGRPLQLRGIAKTSAGVTTFVQSLAGEPRLRDVRLLFANESTIEETRVVQFAVTAHVIGNFPLSEPGSDKRRSRR